MNVRRAYASVSFGQVHYRYGGDTSQPVMVLLHQTPSDSAMYEALMADLGDDVHALAPDTPGMGLSDAVTGELTIPALADALVEFLDAINIDRAVVFGHHTGAAIAAEIAARQPTRVRALVLSGPTLLDATQKSSLAGTADEIRRELREPNAAALWQRLRAKDPAASDAIVRREMANAFRIGSAYADSYDAVIAHDMAAALDAVECPALAVAGSEDPLIDSLDATLRRVQNGRRAEIPGARSFVCETHCSAVTTLLRDFLHAELAA